MAKRRKRKKFNFIRFFKFLFVLACLIAAYYYLSKVPIKNILIRGNKYLSDNYIIEVANIEDYPSFINTSSRSIESKLKKIPLVKDVSVKKKLNFRLEINIEENKVLFKSRNTNEYYLSNKEKVLDLGKFVVCPILINFVPDDVLTKMIDRFDRIDSEVLEKISEIEYAPNEFDTERFMLYMNDENLVYITLNKVKEFNNYNKIKEQIGTNRGILYLDSGNYFEIKE